METQSQNLIRRGTVRMLLILAALSPVLAASLSAQVRNNAQASPTGTPRATALKDFTGYWVSVVTEDWRYRMVVPDKGDYVDVPLNFAGRSMANAWNPANDQAAGNQCKSYGAAAVMYVPGRLHISWQDDNTLRIDTDSGTQTRLFHFGGSASATEKPSWQGYSVAEWGGDEPRDRRDGQGGPVQDKEGRLIVDRAQQKPADYLKVVTTRLRPGYLQKNGVPYS